MSFRAQELPFRYDRGETGAAWPSETTGGGVGLLDYDGDGRLDLFFAQGAPGRRQGPGTPLADVLLRNLGGADSRMSRQRVGLAPRGYGQGVTVADYDGDGDPDVYVTRYGRNTLWRNDRGRFHRCHRRRQAWAAPLWSLGAAFLDYDRDGDLDLFVANYFAFDPSEAPFSRDPQTGARPLRHAREEFHGLPDVLYRNNGDGTFTDVTARAGVAGKGRGMGCLAADFDGDGRLDILVANDAEPNALWRNRDDGTFEDVASPWGIAVNGAGPGRGQHGHRPRRPRRRRAPGRDHHPLLRRARHPLAATNGLPMARLLFEDRTQEAGLAVDTLPTTGWGVALADFDQDGSLDLVVDQRPHPPRTHPDATPTRTRRCSGATPADRRPVRQRLRGRRPLLPGRHLGRGLAAGDLDGDGDLDLVIVHHHDPERRPLERDARARAMPSSSTFEAQGKNRDAIGAESSPGSAIGTLVRINRTAAAAISPPTIAASISAWERPKQVDHIEVRWPDGRVQTRRPCPRRLDSSGGTGKGTCRPLGSLKPPGGCGLPPDDGAAVSGSDGPLVAWPCRPASGSLCRPGAPSAWPTMMTGSRRQLA